MINVPERSCAHCGKAMERKRYENSLESRTVFMSRKFCDQECMAAAMVRERCSSPSHSRMKAHKSVKPACEVCGKTGYLHVHHKDEDHTNNDPSNLKTLCPSCHRHSHSRNFMADGVTRKPCAHCAKPSVRQGLCSSHLSRLKRYGNALAVKVKTASGWVLDTSGLPVRSSRSRKGSRPGQCDSAGTGTP